MRPVGVVNPRSDSAFAALAILLVNSGANDAVELELGLRRQFPNARVTEVRFTDQASTFYAYRDGVWAPDTRT